jgi:hypothetical protein
MAEPETKYQDFKLLRAEWEKFLMRIFNPDISGWKGATLFEVQNFFKAIHVFGVSRIFLSIGPRFLVTMPYGMC